MLSGLGVSNQLDHMHTPAPMSVAFGAAAGGYSPHDEFAYPEGVELVDQQEDVHQPQFASPSSTISPGSEPGSTGQSPHAQDASSVPISTSSELAFALESKLPEGVSTLHGTFSQPLICDQTAQEGYVNYTNGEHSVVQSPAEQLQQHESYFPPQDQMQLQHCQQQQQADPNVVYPAYAFSADGHMQHPPLDYGVYSTGNEYSDHPSANVLDNGLQSVDAFAVYT